MTDRYLIYTPVESVRDEKRFDTAWRSLNLNNASPACADYGKREGQTSKADRYTAFHLSTTRASATLPRPGANRPFSQAG
jgi:hypothetical protein